MRQENRFRRLVEKIIQTDDLYKCKGQILVEYIILYIILDMLISKINILITYYRLTNNNILFCCRSLPLSLDRFELGLQPVI